MERGTHIPQLKLEETEKTITLPRNAHKQIAGLEYYPMTAKKHGVCLIINNMKFENHRGERKKERRGSERDEHNLIETWRYLGYRVEVRRNCSLDEINTIFDSIDRLLKGAKDVEHDSFVCCILSHGKEHLIETSDIKLVKIEDLKRKIGNSKVLLTKPKLFFVQTCRITPGTKSSLPPEIQSDGTIATNRCDTYFIYATSLGDPAMRHPVTGTWFVTELCKLLCEFAKCCSLHDIELKLNKAVCINYTFSEEERPNVVLRQQPTGGGTLGGSLNYNVHFFHSVTEHPIIKRED